MPADVEGPLATGGVALVAELPVVASLGAAVASDVPRDPG